MKLLALVLHATSWGALIGGQIALWSSSFNDDGIPLAVKIPVNLLVALMWLAMVAATGWLVREA